MGKGTRKRQAHVDEMKPVNQALADAKRFDRRALLVFIVTLLILFVTTAMQVLSQLSMYQNLEKDESGITAYSEKGNALEDVEALEAILPSGSISTALIAVGVCLTGVLVMCRCPKISIIGIVIALVGAALFVPFVMEIGELFPRYSRETGDSAIARGLAFKDLLVRHYSMLLPILTIIPSIVFAFQAKKKREVAEVMKSALESGSTLALED
ncbi:MAG: hypothetical protein IKV35_02070 [Clostridia bacterium]|nr:hypothetical protein [Clostridia bacterium]